jgi:hypothetical protein
MGGELPDVAACPGAVSPERVEAAEGETQVVDNPLKISDPRFQNRQRAEGTQGTERTQIKWQEDELEGKR